MMHLLIVAGVSTDTSYTGKARLARIVTPVCLLLTKNLKDQKERKGFTCAHSGHACKTRFASVAATVYLLSAKSKYE